MINHSLFLNLAFVAGYRICFSEACSTICVLYWSLTLSFAISNYENPTNDYRNKPQKNEVCWALLTGDACSCFYICIWENHQLKSLTHTRQNQFCSLISTEIWPVTGIVSLELTWWCFEIIKLQQFDFTKAFVYVLSYSCIQKSS